VTPLSFSSLLSFILPPELSLSTSHPAFASSPIFPPHTISLSSFVGPAFPTTVILARDANNAYFGILHGRCNGRSYRLQCGYKRTLQLRQCNSTRSPTPFLLPPHCPLVLMQLCRLRAIFRLLANNTEITAIAKYHVVVNYMREHAINCFYHRQ